MSQTTFAGHRGVWLRQYSDTAERSTTAILDTLAQFGIDLLVLKCMDGTTWQGSIDARTPVHSAADVLAIRDQCAARGICFAPCVVPRGSLGEAQLHGQLAAAVGDLVIDFEDGQGFYDQAPISTSVSYAQQLRAAAGNAYLMLQPDPREWSVSAINLAGMMPFMNAICAQHYVGWSEVGWTDIAAEVTRFQTMRGYGKDAYITLLGTSNRTIAGQFWQQVYPWALGVQVFSFGAMDAAALRWVGALPMQTPTPTPTPDPCQQQLDALRQQLASVQTDRDRLAVLLRQIAAEATGALA